MLLSILISAGLLFADRPAEVAGQPSDTLHAVTVTADKGVVISRTDALLILNSSDMTGALHQIPGLQLGDYGGYAGLKTLSLRGMGSAHTAVYMDGVRVGNVQSGQGDLGMLDLGNCSCAVVDYAQNSISFNTARPEFAEAPVTGKVRFDMGSFGTYLPFARVDVRLPDRMALSVNAGAVVSKGDFTLADGSRRTNNDILQVRGGFDLFGVMEEGDYHVKAFCNSVERGTPGSVSWPSDDRQKDLNAFLQATLKRKFSPVYTLRLSTKAGYDDINYESQWGDSRYCQTELQLNSSHLFRLRNWCSVSFAADLQYDGLESTNYNASRLTAFTALTGSFSFSRLSLNVAAEYAGYFDMGNRSRHAVSPSLDFRLHLIEGLDVVGFGRRAYRVPVFNELYYVGYGNPDLRPEDAWLTDLGIDFYRAVSSSWKVKAKVDGFFNFLTDKITSAPMADNPDVWLPYNIGKVRSSGLDLVAGAEFSQGNWLAALDLRYSFVSAVDRTPDSITFGQQIPYQAKHTVVTDLKLSWKGYLLNPRWMMRAGRNDASGSLADWNTLDVTASKTFVLRKSLSLGVNLSARNLLDCRYELVGGYPMPGRSFTGGLELRF